MRQKHEKEPAKGRLRCHKASRNGWPVRLKGHVPPKSEPRLARLWVAPVTLFWRSRTGHRNDGGNRARRCNVRREFDRHKQLERAVKTFMQATIERPPAERRSASVTKSMSP